MVSVAYQAFWTEADPKQAVHLFAEAAIADPASPHRWADLADTLLLAGDRERASQCSRRSLQLGPAVPSVLQRAVNFGVMAGCQDHVLQAAGRLLDLVSSEADEGIFGQLSRANCAVGQLQSSLLPAYPTVAGRYLWWLMKTGDVRASTSVWDWIRSKNLGTADLEREYRAFIAEKQGVAR